MRVRTGIHAAVIIMAVAWRPGMAAANPISMEGRTVVVRKEQGNNSPANVRSFNRGPAATSLVFEVSPEAVSSEDRFALRLLGDASGRAPRVRLNGQPVDRTPLRRSDGWIVALPPGRLRTGDNILTVEYREGTKPSEAVEVFSLLDSFEETHFGHAFADPIPELLVQPPQDPLQEKYDVLQYDLSLTLNMTQPVVDGVLSCYARVVEGPMSEMVLDFDPNEGQMVVSSVDAGDATTPLTFTVDNANDRLRISLPSALGTDDTFVVRVAYAGRPATGKVFADAYNVESHGSPAEPVVYTLSEPYGARQWWPCKDVPSDKAPINLHITAPIPYFPVSNGTLSTIQDVGSGMRQYNYMESFPVATYLVSICCSNYTFASGVYTSVDESTSMTVGHYLYPENVPIEGNAVAGTLEALNYLAATFGEYPFLEEKYVTASHNDGAGMEHQTCTSMPGGDLDEGGLGRRNVHELSHMWFGDLVTMDHFNHLWLNEGFATYCEALFYENKYGREYYHSFVDGWDRGGISNTTPLVNPNADSFSGSVVYRRGGYVLHMLRRLVGDEVFFPACRRYLKDHEYGTAVTEDLQAAFEVEFGQPLDWFFQEWMYRAGRPTYRVSWRPDPIAPDQRILVTIDQEQAGEAYVMPADIRIIDFNGGAETLTVWNDQKSQTFEIEVSGLAVDSVEIDPDNYILKYTSTGAIADPPTLLGVESGSGGESARITWASPGREVSEYQLAMSDNLTTWTVPGGADGIPATATEFTATDLTPEKDYYFRIRAFTSDGQPGGFSDIYGARISGAVPRILIVDGYDRWDSQGRGTSHPWAAWHGLSAAAYGASFDTVANEVVEATTVTLEQYEAVLWVSGEESTEDETFSAPEQEVVETYLQEGGNLFVSGAEIGWDLDHRGSASDQAFYHDYLKAVYVADDSNDYSVDGAVDGIFSGLSFNYDNGSAGIYYARYPDVIAPNGSATTLRYNATEVAGVQYYGLFPDGTVPGRLVYFGFGFESIYPSATRDAVMARILYFFQIPPATPMHNLFMIR